MLPRGRARGGLGQEEAREEGGPNGAAGVEDGVAPGPWPHGRT